MGVRSSATSLQRSSTSALGRVEMFPHAPESKPNSKSGNVLDCAHMQMQKKLQKLPRTAQRPQKKNSAPRKRGSIVLLSQDGLSSEPPHREGRTFTYTTLGPMGHKKGVTRCALCTHASMTRLKKKKKKNTQGVHDCYVAKCKEHRGNYQRWQDFSAPTRACRLVRALDYLHTAAYRMEKEECSKKQLN